MAAWASVEQAHAHWPDSASLPDATLQDLLDIATIQCVAYAPALPTVNPPPDPLPPPPVNYMRATIDQAREIYAAGQRDGDVIGLGDYAIRAKPLTAHVQQLLRPQARPPVTG